MRKPLDNYVQHGEAAGKRTPEYRAWKAMKQRCLNPNNPKYYRYGKRGITVYGGWLHNYPAFLAHVGRKPSSKYSLERIDNNKGYEPGNVKWGTATEQARNTRRNILLTFRGQTKTATEWGIETTLGEHVIRRRLKRGWTVENTLTKQRRVTCRGSQCLSLRAA